MSITHENGPRAGPVAGQPEPSRSPARSSSAGLHALQRSAGNAAVVQHLAQAQRRKLRPPGLVPLQRCGPASCDGSGPETTGYAVHGRENLAAPVADEAITMQRSADEDLAAYIAKDLAAYAAGHASPYAHIRSIFARVDPGIQDNVAADFTRLQNTNQLEEYAASPAGRAMLDLLTEAMLTGHVTSFETLQANRILSAKGRTITPEQHAKETTRIAKLRHQAEDSVTELAVDQQAMKLARSMSDLMAVQRYDAITQKIQDAPANVEDNIAAHLIELLTTPQLEAAARAAAGRTMLDVCYDAIITGSVTAFERLQGDRILAARISSSDHGGAGEALENPTIFPLATGWGSTATIVARLRSDGTVMVYYDTKTGARQPQFKQALNTLSQRFGDDKVFTGMILQPDEVVMVQLFDQDGVILPIPAIKLIDFFNQQQEDFIGKVTTITFLGATAGLGGVGGAGILGWADTVAFAISAGSMFVNTYRKDIAKTSGGRSFLAAWDMAEGIADLYGWGRLGVDGLRAVQAKVAPALRRWRAEAATGLSAAERNTIAQAQQKSEAWLDGVKQAEATEIAKAGAAKKAGTGEPARQPADVEPAQPAKARATPTGPPKAPEASKVVAGGHSEVHVTGDRIVVCQLCPDLKDAVGDAITHHGVAAEVAEAERVAARGKPAGAAARAEVALLEAEKVNAETLGRQNVRYKREFIADPALAQEWSRTRGMKRGPSKAAAVHDLELRAARLKAANDRRIEGVRRQAEQLRADAMKNAASAHELKELYRNQPKWVLDDLKRLEDQAVETLKKARKKPLERRHRRDPLLSEEIKRKHLLAEDVKWMERDYRMPHEAEVWVNGKAGKRLRSDRFTSGGVKDLDVAEHGFNEANTLSHTEAKALRELGIHRGETMYINGRYAPCRFCLARMQKAVDTFGGTVVYLWPGGPKGRARFFRGSDTATKLRGQGAV